MTIGFELEKYKMIQVYVSKYGTFNADVDGKEITAETLEALKTKIDAQVKTDLSFKPIDAIEADAEKLVRITSLDRSSVSSSWIYIWVTWEQNGNKRREKTALGDYSDTPRNYSYFYKATPENLAIREKIMVIKKEIADLEDKARILRTTYTNSVTKKDVGADA